MKTSWLASSAALVLSSPSVLAADPDFSKCTTLAPLFRDAKPPTATRIGRDDALFHVVVSSIKRWIVRLDPQDLNDPCLELPIGATKLFVHGDFIASMPGDEKAYFFSGADKAETAAGYYTYGAIRTKVDATPLVAMLSWGGLKGVSAAKLLPDQASLLLLGSGWGGTRYNEDLEVLHVIDGRLVTIATVDLGSRDDSDLDPQDESWCLNDPLGGYVVVDGALVTWEEVDGDADGDRRYERWQWTWNAEAKKLEHAKKLASKDVPHGRRCAEPAPKLTP